MGTSTPQDQNSFRSSPAKLAAVHSTPPGSLLFSLVFLALFLAVLLHFVDLTVVLPLLVPKNGLLAL